jgi:hypothetical protein
VFGQKQWSQKTVESEAFEMREFSAKSGGGRQTLRARIVAQRQAAIHTAKRMIKAGRFVEALKMVPAKLEEDRVPLELEESADLLILGLLADRAYGEALVAEGRRDSPEGDNIGSDVKTAIEVYDLLQRRKKLSDALLFAAEEHMWSVWPEWAVEDAESALQIYSKIGNQAGIRRCENLIAHIAAIKRGETGSVFYRSNTIGVFSSENWETRSDGGLRFYCPRCDAMTFFRVRHCLKCRWTDVDVPESARDARLLPDQRRGVRDSI